MSGPQTQQEAINAFINLANEMKDNGASIQFVSTALMRACAVYATYVVAGNEGALKESGIEKLSEVFAQELNVIQEAKLAEAGRTTEGNQSFGQRSYTVDKRGSGSPFASILKACSGRNKLGSNAPALCAMRSTSFRMAAA